MAKRIALVNQRYGLEVNGGSEQYCRQLAEKLKEIYDVEVITTCALDYTTWEDHYPEGVSEINGVTVRRFSCERSRNKKEFDKLSEKVLCTEHTDEEEREWINAQGPYCPKAVEYLREHYGDYHVVIFTTYLYYLSAYGLSDGRIKNAFHLPTAHDEAPVYLRHYKSVFENPKGIIYLTPTKATADAVISTTDGIRVFFSDIQGNRFEVEDVRKLDAASRRKLELYV